MRSIIHTRRGGPWFGKALADFMSEAGFDLVFNESNSGSEDVVFSDYYKHASPISKGLLLPLNENPFAAGLGIMPDQDYRFLIACRDDLSKQFAESNIHPSCEIRPPWLLPNNIPDVTRPICLFFPCYGNWDEHRCIAMATAVADAMASEAGDLSSMTFLLDVTCAVPNPKHGQSIVRTSSDGSHLWHILSSSLFVCMGSSYVAECSFADHMRNTGLLRTQVFAENIMTGDVVACVDRVIDACMKANDYSEFKRWCVECAMVRDSKEIPAFIDLASFVFGKSGNQVCGLTLSSLTSMLGFKSCDHAFLQARQERSASVFVDKLTVARHYFDSPQFVS